MNPKWLHKSRQIRLAIPLAAALLVAVAGFVVGRAQTSGDPSQDEDAAVLAGLLSDAARAADPTTRAALGEKVRALEVAIESRAETQRNVGRAPKDPKAAPQPDPGGTPAAETFPESEIRVGGQPPPGTCFSVMTNVWRGRIDGARAVVFAGASCDSPRRGQIVVLELGFGGEPRTISTVVDERADGPFTIEAFDGSALALSTALHNGPRLFIVATRNLK